MSATREEFLDRLRELVRDHYQDQSTPLLLSEAGKTLKDEELWPLDDAMGKTLREFIEEISDDDLKIIRSDKSKAYIAIVNSKYESLVRGLINRRDHAAEAIPDLELLPKSVLLAFCVRQEGGMPVYLRKTPPFKYDLNPPGAEEAAEYVRIEERYRRSGLKLNDLSDLSASDKLDLQRRIAAWCRDNAQVIEHFYKSARRTSALERLLAAQPPGLANKIMIPADIALILSKHD